MLNLQIMFMDNKYRTARVNFFRDQAEIEKANKVQWFDNFRFYIYWKKNFLVSQIDRNWQMILDEDGTSMLWNT